MKCQLARYPVHTPLLTRLLFRTRGSPDITPNPRPNPDLNPNPSPKPEPSTPTSTGERLSSVRFCGLSVRPHARGLRAAL